MAHAYARADRAQVCWTLGITEHHNAVDNVFAIINLALLTGHVGRYGSGLVPLRGQNNVQGGGDMGALPNKLPGGQDVENAGAAREVRARVRRRTLPPKKGWHLSEMFEAMEHGELRALYVIGENPAQSEADATADRAPPRRARPPVVQDIFLTRTAELAARRAAGRRVVVRVGRHGHEQRTARAARAQGARSARRRARRHRDPLRARAAPRPGLGPPVRRGALGRAPRALALARRHELPAARRARRPAVAVPRRRRTRAARSCTAGSGRIRSRGRARRSCRSNSTRRSTS